MDAQTRRALSMASGKNEEAIAEVLQPVASTAKYIVSDLAPAMRKAIQKVCPRSMFSITSMSFSCSPMHSSVAVNTLLKVERNMEAFAVFADY